MIYVFPVSTPINTSKTSPQRTTVKLEYGIIVLKYVLFPRGCAGLVGVTINDAIHQIWPTNAGEWFKGIGLFEFNDPYPLLEAPYILDIYTYNTSVSFAHEPIVMLSVKRPDQVFSITGTVELREDLLGGL